MFITIKYLKILYYIFNFHASSSFQFRRSSYHAHNRLTMSLFSQCSVTCGEGTETRLVACITLEHLEGQMMSPTQCDMAVKPSVERLCNLHTCPRIDRIVSISSNDVTGTAHWRVGHFGRVSCIFCCCFSSQAEPCLCLQWADILQSMTVFSIFSFMYALPL